MRTDHRRSSRVKMQSIRKSLLLGIAMLLALAASLVVAPADQADAMPPLPDLPANCHWADPIDYMWGYAGFCKIDGFWNMWFDWDGNYGYVWWLPF